MVNPTEHEWHVMSDVYAFVKRVRNPSRADAHEIALVYAKKIQYVWYNDKDILFNDKSRNIEINYVAKVLFPDKWTLHIHIHVYIYKWVN